MLCARVFSLFEKESYGNRTQRQNERAERFALDDETFRREPSRGGGLAAHRVRHRLRDHLNQHVHIRAAYTASPISYKKNSLSAKKYVSSFALGRHFVVGAAGSALGASEEARRTARSSLECRALSSKSTCVLSRRLSIICVSRFCETLSNISRVSLVFPVSDSDDRECAALPRIVLALSASLTFTLFEVNFPADVDRDARHVAEQGANRHLPNSSSICISFHLGRFRPFF